MTTGLPPFTFDSSTDNTESSTLIDAGIYLLDYGAGNVRSLINAVHHLGFAIKHIKSAADFDLAKKIIFPGVGAFGSCMDKLDALGYIIPLKEYIASNRPFLGICVGMQCLFNFSEESPTTEGLGIIDATVSKFDSRSKTVPHMGWNAAMVQISKNYNPSEEPLINHAGFHPEKSGTPGLELLKTFLNTDLKLPLNASPMPLDALPSSSRVYTAPTDQLSRRIIACLDVRANDEGDLVVTKGDKYDVRVSTEAGGHVRNLGKPVELAKRYYEEGADEITFLNITSFRECPLRDFPMMQVLQKASESVFVPLTIGGGIREIVEPSGVVVSALDVASMYFRSGADKVSIGSDAVYAAEKFWMRGGVKYGDTSIEQISKAYGAQAVVVSVDPRRVYVHTEDQAAGYHTVACDVPGPSGELLCWYQCTVKGGREGRDLDVRQLVTACEALGAGEILLNCMDRDGTNSGFEHSLLCEAKSSVKIPVIASSGAGCVEHFSSMFLSTGADAGLAAGIFHRKEVPISKVKEHIISMDIPCRTL
ncbi:hypothetical protein BASA61_002983 [Batrachochytrium salamandrivorans]|nr:hypothetical protein BASA61_002983 [Batrachochytrium salamandrivorans]